jgi:nitrate/nitrite-specific signal transduction histidine kinase
MMEHPNIADYHLDYPRLAALYEATRDLHASLDLTETLNRVIEKAVWLVGAERGFIMLRESWGEPGKGSTFWFTLPIAMDQR